MRSARQCCRGRHRPVAPPRRGRLEVGGRGSVSGIPRPVDPVRKIVGPHAPARVRGQQRTQGDPYRDISTAAATAVAPVSVPPKIRSLLHLDRPSVGASPRADVDGRIGKRLVMLRGEQRTKVVCRSAPALIGQHAPPLRRPQAVARLHPAHGHGSDRLVLRADHFRPYRVRWATSGHRDHSRPGMTAGAATRRGRRARARIPRPATSFGAAAAVRPPAHHGSHIAARPILEARQASVHPLLFGQGRVFARGRALKQALLRTMKWERGTAPQRPIAIPFAHPTEPVSLGAGRRSARPSRTNGSPDASLLVDLVLCLRPSRPAAADPKTESAVGCLAASATCSGSSTLI